MKQRPILAVLILAVLAFMAAAARAQADTALTLDIKPQKAGSALLQLARKSGVQIMFAEGVGAQVDVDGLKGEYRLEEALAALLNDTGLEYTYAAEELVVVQAVEPAEEPEPADEAPAEDEEAPIELPRAEGYRFAGWRGATPAPESIAIPRKNSPGEARPTLEEFFRTLPWSFPSISTQTNTSRGLLAQDTDVALGQFGLGISTINLRAMGFGQYAGSCQWPPCRRSGGLPGGFRQHADHTSGGHRASGRSAGRSLGRVRLGRYRRRGEHRSQERLRGRLGRRHCPARVQFLRLGSAQDQPERQLCLGDRQPDSYRLPPFLPTDRQQEDGVGYVGLSRPVRTGV